ncbi:NA+/H+ antiporter (napA), putative [hydrothermal vent metagenome]|uniref:NA+/H+ antiporter (NapA), putative n=1 Tax=hydrothermal vent metagenome TaxID=652676 RepID=A0A1W1D5I1_9ZZZZ
MEDNVVLIITISLIIIASPFFAKILKFPVTPIEIVFGSLAGSFGLLHDEYFFDILAEFGFLYLMFIAGTEINLKTIVKTPWHIIKSVLLYLLVLYILSSLFVLYFQLGKIFFILLPLISVGLIATLSKEYGKVPWLHIAMIAGVVGEVLSIVLLTLTSAALHFGFGISFIKVVVSLILFLLFMFIIFRVMQLLFWWFPKISIILMPHKDNTEQDIRLSMGILFLLIGVMLYLDLELAFGAFLAGIFIPTFFEHKKDLSHKLASYGFGFLIPIFFIHIGHSFHIEAFHMDGLIATALLIALAMIMMRVIAAFVFIEKLGFIDAILMGLSHSMPLTLLIALATLAYGAHSIDKLHYYALILAALLQVIGVSIIIKMIHNYKIKH